jgi:signal transduction histidine kinase
MGITVGHLIESWLRARIKFIYNPHFWIILFIVFALTLLYYINFLFIDISDPEWQWLWRLLVFEFTNDAHGSLFCIPFIYAAVIFWWRGILITWLCSIAIILPRMKYYSTDASSFVINLVLLLIPLLIVIIIALQKKWRETERKAVMKREEERQAYLAQIIKVQEDERRRISREIHDDTTQRLWIAANDLQTLASDKLRSISRQTAVELERIRDTILGISDDARRLSIALRPGILDDLGLVPAIRWLVEQLNSEGNIEAKLSLEGVNQRQLNQEINTHIFRIAQEALNNIRRHSEAKRVTVTLKFNPETIKMTIKDNGKGFSFKDVGRLSSQGKLGLIGIQERVRLLDGIFRIDSKHGKGTVISIEFGYPSLEV